MQLAIPPDTGQLRGVRRVLEGWAAAHNVAAETLSLVATELVANAIAVSPVDELIELSIQLDDEAVTLVVADRGPGGLDHADIRPAELSSLRGRGLHIVSSLSNRVTVDRIDGRTAVTVHQYRRMLGPLPEPTGHGTVELHADRLRRAPVERGLDANGSGARSDAEHGSR